MSEEEEAQLTEEWLKLKSETVETLQLCMQEVFDDNYHMSLIFGELTLSDEAKRELAEAIISKIQLYGVVTYAILGKNVTQARCKEMFEKLIRPHLPNLENDVYE